MKVKKCTSVADIASGVQFFIWDAIEKLAGVEKISV